MRDIYWELKLLCSSEQDESLRVHLNLAMDEVANMQCNISFVSMHNIKLEGCIVANEHKFMTDQINIKNKYFLPHL